MNKNKYINVQLFLAQCIAVFIWFLITVVQWSNNPKNSPGVTITLIVRGVEALSVFLISGVMIYIVNRVRHFFKTFFSRILLLFAFYFFAISANVISIAIRGFIGYAPPKIDSYFFIQSLHFYIPLFLVFVVYSLVKNRIELQTEREDKLKAEGLAQQAKWMMLRYQVNPHFLFNALNSIRALIGHDDDKARKIVTEMSEYFRYSLSIEKKSLVLLKEEINAVDNYLEIQQIRYPERLKISKAIDPTTLDCVVPVFAIQTLIENAVKYGLKTHDSLVKIGISVLSENEKLRIQISNTGRFVQSDETESRKDGTNTGIENLKRRLRFLDKNYQFNLYEEGDEVVATILLTVCKKYENLENNTY